MNQAALQTTLRKLVKSPDRQAFIFELLLAYGLPKSQIKLLRNSPDNNLDVDAELSMKRKVFFRHLRPDHDPLNVRTQILGSLTQRERFIVLTDYERLYAYDTKLDEPLDCDFTDLPDHYDFFLPWAGIEKSRQYDENPADVKAAERMARLFDLIRQDNPDRGPDFAHHLNVFLSRVLFCFFAEDTGIFPGDNLFSNGIGSQTHTDGSDLQRYLHELFTVLNTPQDRRTELRAHFRDFPYVNGGLFRDRIELPVFGERSRRALIDAGGLSWADINPDIFGSMIQAVVDPEKRGGLGMHYTSIPNIMKVIEPLFLDDLREAFISVRDSRYEKDRLDKLRERLGKIKIFDPACGSGNFLIIAYKELRKLEMQIIQRYHELGGGDAGAVLFGKGIGARSTVTLDQFYGIEIDDFAHEIAILALWLAEIQMNVLFGLLDQTLPLKQSGKIVHANACRVDWEEVCPKVKGDETYILGNPPYLGFSIQNKEQKEDIQGIVGSSTKLDYIAAWFLKGSEYLEQGKSALAFVSTNSICQGEQVEMLWPSIFDRQVEIFFCNKNFKWSNSARDKAGVVCSIVGISSELSRNKIIYSKESVIHCAGITPYLTEGSKNLYIKKRRQPLSAISRICLGNAAKDGGALLLNEHQKNQLVSRNHNADKYIKHLTGSEEFVHSQKAWCLWFEADELSDALAIEPIRKRLKAVAKMRSGSKKKATQKLADTPHQFGEIRHKNTEAIIVPIVGSARRDYVPIGYLGTDIVVKNSAFVIYDASLDLFSITISLVHFTWLKAVGGQLKSDYRYSSQLVYNTFPFPPITDAQKAELEQTALDILAAREMHPGKTLAELYDPDEMPEDLREAHRTNDLAVERCYRPEPFESDEERLAYLFKLYEKMVAGEEARKPTKKANKKRARKKS